jgi:aspartate aminotransferase-like enzyme
MTSSELHDRVLELSGIEIAVGQGAQTAVINRIGHMGWVDEPELRATLEALGAAIGTSS